MLSVGVMSSNTEVIESAQKLDIMLQHEVKNMFEYVIASSDFEAENPEYEHFYEILSQSLSKLNFASREVRRCQLSQDSNAAIATPITTQVTPAPHMAL